MEAFTLLLQLAVVGLVLSFVFGYLRLWYRAKQAGFEVSFTYLFEMRLRGVSPHNVVNAGIVARRGGIQLSVRDLETHCLCCGNADRLVEIMLAAKRAGTVVTYQEAATIDMSGVIDTGRDCSKKYTGDGISA